MSLSEFCGKTEFSILQFTYYLTDDVKDKIDQKKLFYNEQIERYIYKQVDLFFQNYDFNNAIVQTYKYEIYTTIIFRLKDLINKKIIFSCVSGDKIG